RGAVLALVAAVLFGASTPLVQRFGVGLGPFTTAALLYAGAALVGAISVRGVDREAKLVRSDLGRVLAMAACGAVVGPVALAWALQRTSAAGASLLLTLEVVFTALLARRLYGESIDRRVGVAMALLASGALLLVARGRDDGVIAVAGLFAVVVATAAWGLDNALSRGLAERDPGRVVMAKAALGAIASSLLAIVFGEALPSATATFALLAVGATGYGLSLRFYLLAQRAFGAARTASVFAFAPFIGAAIAFALGDRSGDAWLAAGGALMLAGIVLHLAERHGHEHGHDALEHEHAHRHDDGHHEHGHAVMPEGPHSHRHAHRPTRHAHAHMPDAHHVHRH
ncbi:MAG: DMT family transporter, partial [Pseudomonadota bacterium]|nr:DMT family transporter [Pseudomonadota bacterium]